MLKQVKVQSIILVPSSDVCFTVKSPTSHGAPGGSFYSKRSRTSDGGPKYQTQSSWEHSRQYSHQTSVGGNWVTEFLAYCIFAMA